MIHPAVTGRRISVRRICSSRLMQHGPIFSHSAMVIQAGNCGRAWHWSIMLWQNELDAGRPVCPFKDILVGKMRFIFGVSDSPG